MKTEVIVNTSRLLRRYGTVKWFGGVNSMTGRENHFGFIEDLSGKDVFAHRREWRGRTQPAKGELVTYLEEQKDGKFSACQAESLDAARIGASEWYSALCAPPLNAGKLATLKFQEAVEERLRHSLADSGPEDLHLLLQMSHQPGAPSIFCLVSSGMDAVRNYVFLLEAAGLRVTDDAPWAGLSHRVSSHFETEIAAHLAGLEPQVAREKCSNRLTVLPSSVLTYMLTKGIFTTTDQLGSSEVKRIYDYVSSVIIRGTATCPDYLRASLDASLVTYNGQSSKSG